MDRPPPSPPPDGYETHPLTGLNRKDCKIGQVLRMFGWISAGCFALAAIGAVLDNIYALPLDRLFRPTYEDALTLLSGVLLSLLVVGMGQALVYLRRTSARLTGIDRP